MAAKKKNAETLDAVEPSAIAVDAHKLSQGLKMTFEGMAMVFDSMGVDMGAPTVKADNAKVAIQADKSVEDKAGGVEETVSGERDMASVAEDQNVATEAEPSVAKTEDTGEDTAAEAQPDASEPTSTVSLDDITKIIVQKIKQNRSNNAKIGSILKTYGVAKVGDLPASKYEAFLTDLSAI